jgi:pyruvate/2-oxoglutarate dehydrogenase complex dihydrolipoamide acyltransferase (E2) component
MGELLHLKSHRLPWKMFTKNVQLGSALKLSNWRKAAFGLWTTAGDPSTYGTLEVDATRAMAYVDRLRASSGEKITLTHFVGKVIGEVFFRHPEINVVLRWGRLYARKHVDVFFQVANDEAGRDLSGATVHDIHKLGLPEVCQALQAGTRTVRHKADRDYSKMKSYLGGIPGFLAWPFLRLVGFIAYSLNLYTPLFGLPKDAFGSVMVTSIGSLGLDEAYAPLVAYGRTPMIVSVGAVRKRVVVQEGAADAVVIRPMMKICVTFDHRIMDGKHAAHMTRTLMRIFADPESEFARASAQV